MGSSLTLINPLVPSAIVVKPPTAEVVVVEGGDVPEMLN